MGKLAYPLKFECIIPGHRFDVRSAAPVSKVFDIRYLDVGGLLISALLLFVVSFIDNRIKTRKRPRFMT